MDFFTLDSDVQHFLMSRIPVFKILWNRRLTVFPALTSDFVPAGFSAHSDCSSDCVILVYTENIQIFPESKVRSCFEKQSQKCISWTEMHLLCILYWQTRKKRVKKWLWFIIFNQNMLYWYWITKVQHIDMKFIFVYNFILDRRKTFRWVVNST